ncbi:ubiquitin carboxyl-terminal hydrolase 31 [Bombina bombina]|uniref:ubiquitin carboxyl-terminal hydrolase 31 n=1 Tax=Bombina bombina TaxID=8345 RepID=UPI00235A5B41|nr:ubiquitin carboxyl-terminal hydrolase 31 [Bombina bombina]
MSQVSGTPAAPAACGKEKKASLGKKLFWRRGGFVSRFLRTLSTLSHLSTEHEPEAKSSSTARNDPAAATVPEPDQSRLQQPQQQQPPPPSSPKVPGLAGIKNHGNTCFMNAVLQCLSNTDLFAEFLGLEQYRESDDSENNQNPSPLPSPGAQDRGEVTEQLAKLLRSLWTLEYTPQHSREFKTVVSKNAHQYRGTSQHDAQEFLLWLLDRVHEDLNIVVKHKPRPPLEEDLTGEVPHFLSSGTFVQELFQAQYRSSLTCPHCQKQSNTFDPFLCISLPIPLPHTRPLYVTVVYQGKCSHCMRIGVAVPLSGNVARLREAISTETKIPKDQIVITEMYFDGFHRSFSDNEDLDTIHESDCLFAFETPEIFQTDGIISQRGICVNNNQNYMRNGTDSNRSSLYSSGSVRLSTNRSPGNDRLVLLVCNRAYSGQHGRRFGQPFVLHLERNVTWDILQKEILEKMQYSLRPSVCVQVCPFSLRVVTAVGITYLLPQEEKPLCHPTVERALKSCGSGGAAHVKMVVEWDRETKEYLFGNTEEEYVPDAESVRLQREVHHQPQCCSLAQCFQLYTKEEQLAPGNAWRCPHCKQLQQGSIKLSLWTLPDVLILHLKRFRQDGDRRLKLQNMVRFPLTGLDMTPHVVKRSQSSWSLPSHWSPWRRPYGLGRDPEEFVYDLYAVCNHHGTMHGGHYTAYCKNSVDGMWYCFDDSEVQLLPEDDVCKQTAYILFYQRRAAVPSWSANSSVAGSTSSSLCDHWISRLPGSRQPSIASAASSRRTSLASLAESVELTGERSEDDGGFSSRPFVRSVQRQSTSGRSSVTSPLVANENGFRPSWSLAAKLHLRSATSCRHPSDSPTHGSSLSKIGEADDHVSTSCFGSLRNLSGFHDYNESVRKENRTVGRAPLAIAEGNTHGEPAAKKAVPSETFGKGAADLVGRNPLLDPIDNNNHIAYVDQSDSVNSSPVKENSPQSEEIMLKTNVTSKAIVEQEKTPRAKVKDPSPSATSSINGRHVTKTKKSDVTTPVRRASTQHKKETGRVQDTPTSASQLKQKSASPAISSNSSPAPKKLPQSSKASNVSTSSIKPRPTEKTLSREGSKVSLGSDKASTSKSGSSSVRVPQSKTSELSTENRTVRSSSMASLRTPHSGTRSNLKRDSKSEDKGLSFFKSALRQKESRRSADLGKTTLLSKKTPGTKSSAQEKSEVTSSSSATEAAPNLKKHSALPAHKAKSSSDEKQAQPSPTGKKTSDKYLKRFPSTAKPSKAQ